MFPTVYHRRVGRREGFKIHNGSREEPKPQESFSLADYVKIPASSTKVSALSSAARNDSLQSQLEKDFPKLDTALIAAILADHQDSEATGRVLSSLS